MTLSIGQTVKIPAYNPDGSRAFEMDIEGVVKGLDFGGVIVRVELPTHPKPETFEFITAEVIEWNKQT